MKFLFDLDYTLLDTEAFKKALEAAVVSTQRPSVEDFRAAYGTVAEKTGMFDAESFFAELKDAFSDDYAAAEARAAFEHVLTETERYLYPEAKELLEVLRRHKGATVDLMTFGNERWQRAKVEHSGLDQLFDEKIFTDQDKSTILRDAGSGEEKVIVVNDNGEELRRMIAAVPEYTYILKKGPKPVPMELASLPTAETMQELAALLEKETGWELRREMREVGEKPEPPRTFHK